MIFAHPEGKIWASRWELSRFPMCLPDDCVKLSDGFIVPLFQHCGEFDYYEDLYLGDPIDLAPMVWMVG